MIPYHQAGFFCCFAGYINRKLVKLIFCSLLELLVE